MSAQTPGFIGLAQGGTKPAHSPSSMPARNKPTSAPGTPRLAVDTSDHAPVSPSLLRRSSSHSQRPPSSASPRLVRKTSRTSLGSSSPVPHDEGRRPTPKRSISNLITELRGAQATMEAIPEPVILTAPQIAQECFENELAGHEEAAADTIVLLHDACYGHRFSRLKSTKTSLSMIVERPERLLASVLGVATTYVRLGGYHAGERNAPRPRHKATAQPPFKIRRTSRTLDIKSSYVTNVHGTEWMSELGTMCGLAGQKLAACEKEVARQGSSFGEDKRSLHEGDLYLCDESRDAFEGALGGVADAVDAVFSQSPTQRAFVAVRPPGHHCSADYPSGFCWVNNVHVGIEYAAQTYDLTHAAIIDFDLHHGDGSQAITWERNSKNNLKRLYPKSYAKTKLAPDIGYYSIHDINSYPCEMGDDEKVQAASLCIHQAHGQSIWNVHLQTWKTIEEFWTLYESRYTVLLDKARDFLQQHTKRIIQEGKQRPNAAIFVSAGFDASEWEGEGMQRHKVNVPTEFYARFTEDIMKVAQDVSTGCQGRVVSVLEGGYSDRALCSSTMSHLAALSSSGKVPQRQPGGLSTSMLHEQMEELSLAQSGYEASWWSAANLEALEHHVNPPAPSLGGKKVRAGPHPTYATPTESFAYKVIDPAKFARSVSGTMREGVAPTRSATPPPPDVDWIVAAHELSKLLIPGTRSTTSHTAESLAGPKVKKERASSAELGPSPDDPSKPRQLRTRGKPTAATPIATSKRSVSSSDRRKTMGDFSSVAIEADSITVTSRRPSRRSSMASTTSTASALPDADAPPVPAIPAQRPATAVQVKKTRMPATPGPKPKKTVSVANRTPSALVAAIATPARGPPDANVDALASGMKRITLKVGSREESERKAKEKLDADRRARALKAAETRRINKAAKEAKAAQERLVTADLPTSSEPSSAVDDTSVILSPSKPEPAMYTQPAQDQTFFGQYQQAMPPQLNGMHGYSHQMPQQANGAFTMQHAPAPPQSLPVFSSTGHIPFAGGPPQHYPGGPTSQGGQYTNMGPPQQYYGHSNVQQPGPADFFGQQPQQLQQPQGMYGQPQMPSMNAHDVWAVPDTPAKETYGPER